MANRYQTIVNNIVDDLAKQMEQYLAQLPHAGWFAKDGKLIAVIKGEEYEMSFEPGDPLTRALLLFLNNKDFILSRLRCPS